MITGARIPKEYVRVSGAGQSDFGPGIDPWETASYDIALLNGGIENCNIVVYTSVLPFQATEISLKEAYDKGYMHHGMVLECIKAETKGNKGEALCAGIGTCQVYQKQPDGEEVHIGGFAAEYEGPGSEDNAKRELELSLKGIIDRRYGDDPNYIARDFEYTVRSIIVDKDFGCVLVALGFVRFEVETYEE